MHTLIPYVANYIKYTQLASKYIYLTYFKYSLPYKLKLDKKRILFPFTHFLLSLYRVIISL